jgi:lysylphosphatidylglycerol synthetase-like protein (DUF2156 family)
METNYLAYLVLLSQLILLSYYYPKKIADRIKQLLQDYPPSTYPKLYPQSEAKLLAGRRLFKWLNWGILLLGTLVLCLVIYTLEQELKTAGQLAFIPLVLGLIQAIPYALLELSNYQQLKVMRALNNQSRRQAELAPRNLFSFISPAKVFSAVVLFITCAVSMLYFENFNFSFDLIVLLSSMLLSNGLFVFVTINLLYGKKMDPHQSATDRAKMIRANLHSFVYTSILISVYFILNKSVDAFNWQHIEIIFNSLYWQFVIFLSTGTLLRGTRLDAINFEVYRA